ncbi:MAG TPA: DinB family protein [Gemmatimonadaceae bacterium]|nr:DinB family protein [Gemmatimonadaceae bacterium]
MTEHTRIADQIRRAANKNAWHGPALAEVLARVSAEQAASHPLSGAHSIWELVGHITTWTDAVRRRFEGDNYEPTEAENFPAVADRSPGAWKAACDSALAAHEALARAVERRAGADLDAPVFERPYTVYGMLHGAAQHTLYHAGQIALIRRALGAPVA